MPKVVLVIHIDKNDFDYEILVDYLLNKSSVTSISETDIGIIAMISYNSPIEYDNIIDSIRELNIKDMSIHSILKDEKLQK